MNTLKTIGVMCLALLLIACEQAPAPEIKTPVRIGTNVWPGYEPLYLARQLDNWSSEQLRLVEYPSASEVLRAFRNRSIEAASLTLDEVMLLKAKGVPLSVVLVHDVSDGGDVILAKPEIDSMQMLKGKRIGVEAGALGAMVVTRALEVNGLSLRDVAIVNRDVNMHEGAFKRSEVDAVVTFEPVRTRLMKLGAKEVFTSKEIPGEIVDVLVVHDEVLKKRPEDVRLVIKSWFTALQHMQVDMQDAASRMARRLNITPAEVIESYDGLILPDIEHNKAMLGGAAPGLAETAQQINRVMVLHQLFRNEVDTTDLFTDAYLPQP